ncbi:hypothetical protein [Priestia aryabhattai]
MNKIDIDKISIMPISLEKVIGGLSCRGYVDEGVDLEDGEEIELVDDRQIKLIKNLEFIVGYGRGYWAGIDEEITLIRLKNTREYYWFYTDYSSVRTYKETKQSAEKVLFSMTMEQQKRYFVEVLTKFEQAPLIPGDLESFCSDVWSNIANQNRSIRKQFKYTLSKIQKAEKQERLQKALKQFKETPGLVSIEISSDRLIAKFPGDLSYEIKEADREVL